MVIHDKKIAYIHTRKCAGCAIIESFQNSGFDLDWNELNFGAFPIEKILEGRSAYGVWDRDKFSRYKIFTSVRNPFDRLVSGYHYSRFGRKFGATEPLEFSNFIRSLPTRVENFQWWTHLTLPLSDMLFDDKGCIAEFIIRFENIDTDFQRCCEWLGVENLTLTKTNVSRDHYEYRSLYTAEDRKLVYKIFERDFDHFKYSF